MNEIDDQGLKRSGDLDLSLKGAQDAQDDDGTLAYIIFFLLGTGFLLPWNAFITAVDYFSLLYPTQHVDSVFAVAYMVPNVSVLFLLVAYFGKAPSRTLISSGFFMFFLLIASVPILDALTVKPDGLGTAFSFACTVAAVTGSGVVDAMIQGSLFGMASELPPQYIQALAAGTSASGLSTSLLRILTKLVLPGTERGLRWSAYLYFAIAAAALFLCAWAYHRLSQLRVIKRNELRRASFTALISDVNALAASVTPPLTPPAGEFAASYSTAVMSVGGTSGVQAPTGKHQTAAESSSEQETGSLLNAESCRSQQGHADVAEQELVDAQGALARSRTVGFWGKIFLLDALSAEAKALSVPPVQPGQQWEILSLVWPYAASLTLVYLVTLSIFPGFLSEIKDEELGSWYPILLFFAFNLCDFVGKMTPVVFVIENDGLLFALVLGRFLFYPLYSASLGSPTSPMALQLLLPLLTLLLGFSNGILTSLLLMAAPAVVPEDLAEATGTIMILFLVLGLALGSVGAWFWISVNL